MAQDLSLISEIQSWITDNFNSIVTGMVASVIVLLSQSLVRAIALLIASWVSRSLSLSPIWGFHSSDGIYVISGTIDEVSEEIRGAILMGPDADAANESIATIRFLRSKVRIFRFYSPKYPNELLRENLISVGGPINNYVTSKLMSSVSDLVSFEEFILKNNVSNETYETEYEDEDEKTAIQDYGLILKLPSPYAQNTDVLVLAGCDTYGVLAAARAISLHPDGKRTVRQILRKLGPLLYFKNNYYFGIFRCDVIGNDIGNIKLMDFQKIKSSFLKNKR